MNTRARMITGLVAAGVTVAAAVPFLSNVVSAADHLDAPKTTANQAADITDIYAWHTDDAKIVVVLNFAGLGEAGAQPVLDDKIVYGIHVDNDGDNVADFDTWVRFGKNGSGEWGVQVVDLPGGNTPISGALGDGIDAGLGLRAWAGLADDPFFFDLEGFKDTLTSGTISFMSGRDTFAKTNVMSIVLQMSADAVLGGGNTIQVWGSTRGPA